MEPFVHHTAKCNAWNQQCIAHWGALEASQEHPTLESDEELLHQSKQRDFKWNRKYFSRRDHSLFKLPSPFIITNSISFSISKRKSQIKATSHIPAETCELHYSHVLQTPAISHSEMRLSNKSFTSILTVTGISKPKLLIKTLKSFFLKNKPEIQP